jgi:hypothetical protein
VNEVAKGGKWTVRTPQAHSHRLKPVPQIPQRLKAGLIPGDFTARLKPCPDGNPPIDSVLDEFITNLVR